MERKFKNAFKSYLEKCAEVEALKDYVVDIHSQINESEYVSIEDKAIYEKELMALPHKYNLLIEVLNDIIHEEDLNIVISKKGFVIASSIIYFSAIIGSFFTSWLLLLYFVLLTMGINRVIRKHNFNKIIDKQGEIKSVLGEIRSTTEESLKLLELKEQKFQDIKETETNIQAAKLSFANDLIQFYLQNNIIPELPKEYAGIVIKMLQEDLKTDETSLEKLLQMVKEKTNVISLEEGHKLDRNI